MKAVAKALFNEPVVFLAVVGVGIPTALALAHLVPAWAPAAAAAIVTPLQRYFVKPDKPRR